MYTYNFKYSQIRVTPLHPYKSRQLFFSTFLIKPSRTKRHCQKNKSHKRISKSLPSMYYLYSIPKYRTIFFSKLILDRLTKKKINFENSISDKTEQGHVER